MAATEEQITLYANDAVLQWRRHMLDFGVSLKLLGILLTEISLSLHVRVNTILH